MNEPDSKQINQHARIFLRATDWTKLNSIKPVTHNHIIWFVWRSNLVQLVAPRRTRAEIICWRVDSVTCSRGSLIVRAIEMIDVHQNSGFHAEARVKGFKAFQSSRICFKYSEKQIGFSHRNLYKLHLLSNSSPAKTWLSTRNRIFSSTSIPLRWPKFFRMRRESESEEPNAVIYKHPKFFKWA